jgi:hypothetical protein
MQNRREGQPHIAAPPALAIELERTTNVAISRCADCKTMLYNKATARYNNSTSKSHMQKPRALIWGAAADIAVHV